ncbi:hypothetical protein ABZU94_07280 [Streptomyces mirabilis]|uniref:hypothetical protein n=1 Tax=Streptomyces sp. NPDC005388 TaxID=3156717 RepID=UPI0033A71EB0
MVTKTSKAERAVKAEQRRINRELRAAQRERKPYLSGAWINERGWWGIPYCTKPCGEATCEGCASRAYGLAEAEQYTGRIAELKAELMRLDTPAPEPVPLRQATVITGRGEQLVMFV